MVIVIFNLTCATWAKNIREHKLHDTSYWRIEFLPILLDFKLLCSIFFVHSALDLI